MRCFGEGKPFYEKYHDEEWAVPVHDERKLFEMLILEGAQAGLSWETILKKREGYRKAFHGFDPVKVAAMTDGELDALREDPSIVRNRLKIYAARTNAQVFLEFDSFEKYIWSYVDGTPVVGKWKTWDEVPTSTAISDALSKDLKKRGMSFVGTTIIYSFMQAVGMVDDHLNTCLKRKI